MEAPARFICRQFIRPLTFIVLCLCSCKTVGSADSWARSVSEDDIFKIEAHLRKKLTPKEAEEIRADLHRTPLTKQQANRLLFATLHPKNSAATVSPIVESLVQHGGSVNSDMEETLVMSADPVVPQDRHGARNLACGALTVLARAVSDSHDELDKLRFALLHGEADVFETSEIDNMLKCSENYGWPQATYAETRLTITCSFSLRPSSFSPECPHGWDRFAVGDKYGRMEDGCVKKNEAPQEGGVSEADKAEFQRLCPGSFDVDVKIDSAALKCWTSREEEMIPCPSGFIPISYSNDKFRGVGKPFFVQVCSMKMQHQNPLGTSEPHASHIRAREEVIAEKRRDMDEALKKLAVAGIDLDLPCREFKSIREWLEFDELLSNRNKAVPPPPKLGTLDESDDITSSQILVLNINSQRWMTKIFIQGRCPIELVKSALQDAINRTKGLSSIMSIYVSEVGHECGLEKVRVVHVDNHDKIRTLIKEDPSLAGSVISKTPEEALAKYQHRPQ